MISFKKLVVSFVILSFLYTFNHTLYAQKQLSLPDAITLKQRSLMPERLLQLKWIPNSLSYYFIEKKEAIETLYLANAKNPKEKKNIITLAELSKQLPIKAGKELKTFPTLNFTNEQQVNFEYEGQLFVVDLTTKKISASQNLPVLGENADDMDKATNNYIAYTLDNNLFIHDGKEAIAISKDGSDDLVYGKSVHRDEFGIHKGTFWSPSGNKLAFYRMDQTKVTDYPIMDIDARPAKGRFIKYPMAGDTSHFVTIGVYNTTTKNTIYLKTGTPADQYLTNIAWSPDEQHIYVAILNRDQNQLLMNSYHAETGNFEKTLFEEKHEKYVQPLHPLEFVKGHDKWFIWQSERDGYNHIYLYDTDGKLIKQLTKGQWVVTQVNGFDQKGEQLFFTGTIESPVTRQLCKVNLKSGKLIQITSGSGTHGASVSFDGQYALDHFQSLDTPREQSLYACSSPKKLEVLKLSENPLKEYTLGKLSIFTIPNKDGLPLYSRLILPVNFDSTKKYPVLVYQYGGPNAQMVNNTWNGGSNDLWFQYLAQHGFIVFTLDPRGSENRGREFEQATFRHLGKAEMEDQLAGVQYLTKKSWVDTSKMALFGWSFGGFMTTSIMLKHPHIFKVAVAGGPVIDWKYYEIMYTERYMDSPQQNPEGYKETKTTEYINNLKGRLMLIHGTEDPVVVWQHSLMFLKACIEKGKLVDYFVYPGHEHNVHGKDRVHLYMKITDYMMQHLKGGK